jgi:hypothetical protein
MKSTSLAGPLALALSTAATPAQAPDVLIPSGSLDGIFRLLDRDGDGAYNSVGEAYDYVLHGRDSSVRNIIWIPGNPPRLYYNSTVLEKLLFAWDSNADGIIQLGTEELVALDFATHFGSATHEVNGIAYNGNGVFYVTNDSGTVEGIHRCQDLTGDGDFDDPNETTPALVEPTHVFVTNAPNSNNPPLVLDALDSITFDPTWGASGRYLIEEETNDFTLAVEDKNNDGDFDEPGEAYLFCALWNGGTLAADVHPDVANGTFPSSNEIREHAVDTRTTPPTYYLASIDTNLGGPDNAIVYRGVDLNGDGDINDAGEISIFWDGSSDSAGAETGYNFCTGLEIANGEVYITAEWAGVPDEESYVRLRDLNLDGDAQDPGETIALWRLGQDKTHYTPLTVPAGVLPPAPPGNPGTYRYYGDATCRGSTGTFHNIQSGTDNFNDKCTIGNAGFFIRTWGVVPNGVGAYNIGVAATSIPLDPPNNLCHVYTLPLVSFPFGADSIGENNTPLPIPNDPGLIGALLFWQSLVLDPPATLGLTTSDGIRMTLGAANYSYSVH